MNQKNFRMFSWAIVAITITAVVYAWGSGVSWKIGSITPYQWFPLFGLIAWTIMAGHYYTGVFRVQDPTLTKPKFYEPFTGYLVLGSLLLHPGILAIEQAKNDQGLPPTSFYNYVSNNLKLAVVLGSLSLVLFLSFEVFNRLKNNKTIQKYWWAVSVSQTLAMTMIWVHGLRLGTNLGDGWFRIIWFIMGASLIPCFYIIHKSDFSQKN